jgi:hypothetical protein
MAEQESPTLNAAVAALHRERDALIARTRAWVEVNSFTANVAGVNAVGELLRASFALPSLTCEVIPGGDHGDHLVWRTPAAAHQAPAGARTARARSAPARST